MIKKILLPLLVIALAVAAIRHFTSVKEVGYIQLSGTVFGTFYHITYQGDTDLHDEIRETFRAFDASLSMFNPTSVISRFNEGDSTARADEYFTTCFRRAMEVSERTDGAFDITIAPLVNAWGFGFKNSDHVTRADIDSLRGFVGHRLVSLDDSGRLVRRDPRVVLDASSIAKGYASDVIAALLHRHGVKNYMVEIGGEIAVLGVNPHGAPWAIGINKPTDNLASTLQEIDNVIYLTAGGMATSGNYRNFYDKDGRRYAHTIDPHTGYPVQQDILSSTVLAPDCMTADAYATAFMVLGTERSLAILAADTTLAAYFIVQSSDTTGTQPYEIIYSPRLATQLKRKQ